MIIAKYLVAVSTSDTVNLASRDTDPLADGFYVGTSTANGQDVVVVLEDGTAITFKNVLQGTAYWVRFKRINATGTTASNLLALYR